MTCAALGAALAVAGGALPAGESAGRDGTRSFRFTYSVVVRDIPGGARRLSIWVPVPRTDRHQRVLRLAVEAPLDHSVTQEKRYGNRLVHLSAAAPLPDTVELRLEAVVTRRAFHVLAGKPSSRDHDPPTPADLSPDSLVPIHGPVAAAAREATRGARTTLQKARAIYEHVTSTMRYDRSGTGWGRGDAVYACDARRGNCTDFHSLIVGMARASGIPARFVMGFPLPADRKEGSIAGYHCWAELFVEGVGWLPLDSSEASKHPERRAFFFGGLDANRLEFTRGRDLELDPPASEPLNFFIYPRVEVDGAAHAGVEHRFSFIEIET
jgi:transglutaminase-like putative cysteine protease